MKTVDHINDIIGALDFSEKSQYYVAFRLLTVRLTDIINSLDSPIIGKGKEKKKEIISNFQGKLQY